MMYPDKKILDVLNNIKLEHPEFDKYGGLGYCLYGSELLRLELISQNINAKFVTGMRMSDTIEGCRAKSYLTDMVLRITDQDGIYAGIRKTYMHDQLTWPNTTGHAVVVVEGMVYDITSGQFGLPRHYPLDMFIKMFEDVRETILTVDLKATFNAGKTDRHGDKMTLSNESLKDKNHKHPIHIDSKHEGDFRKWLGKTHGEPITDADIERGLKSNDPHVRKMAQFAKNSKKWKHDKKIITESMPIYNKW